MNVTQLRAFVSVVDLGSFSEAARRAGVSQPAVTMQIKALEADIGATLLDRRYRRVELTEAGKALLPHARNVLADPTVRADDARFYTLTAVSERDDVKDSNRPDTGGHLSGRC